MVDVRVQRLRTTGALLGYSAWGLSVQSLRCSPCTLRGDSIRPKEQNSFPTCITDLCTVGGWPAAMLRMGFIIRQRQPLAATTAHWQRGLPIAHGCDVAVGSLRPLRMASRRCARARRGGGGGWWVCVCVCVCVCEGGALRSRVLVGGAAMWARLCCTRQDRVCRAGGQATAPQQHA